MESAAPHPILQTIPDSLVEFKMIPIPDGEIVLGGEKIEIKNLAFGETEVTWDLFDIWVFGFDLTPEQNAAGFDAESRPSKPYGAPDQGYGHSGYPAITMTFHGAEAFCQWLSRKTGRPYRLPTEAEWEYAARAGEIENPSEIDRVAWFCDNSDDKTWPVGKKAPNAWELYDILGNVAEWAIDSEGKPVTCGGHFLDNADKIGFDSRTYPRPKWIERDPQNPKSEWWMPDGFFVGFRLVLENNGYGE